MGSFSIPLLSFDDVSHVEPTLAALSFPAQAVLVEWVAAHKVYGRES